MIDKSSAFFGSLAKVYLVKWGEIEREKGASTHRRSSSIILTKAGSGKLLLLLAVSLLFRDFANAVNKLRLTLNCFSLAGERACGSD
jgi:hypothetical protein